MEKKFYPDNFEQLLKESTDNFRMYPSKRVWHSIYNDLHPSRKWPSLAIWVLFISSIVYIGLSNKNQFMASNGNAKITASHTSQAAGAHSTNPIAHSNTFSNKNLTLSQRLRGDLNNTSSVTGNNKSKLSNSNIVTNLQATALTILNKQKTGSGNSSYAINNVAGNNSLGDPVAPNLSAGSDKENISMTDVHDLTGSDSNEKEPADVKPTTTKQVDVDAKKKLAVTDKDNNNADKEWIEDYAFHNKPFASKWRSRTTYQLYFTPSVGYRFLSKNTNFNPVSTASLVATAGNNVADYKKALSQAAAVNMEIGGNIFYSIAKNWNLKAGIQVNYTNYVVNAYELKHPTMTTLTLNDLNNGLPLLDPRSTTLANTSGVASKKLNNNTYQVSLPLGADIKIAGKNNLKWYAGATVQPTYIIKGKAYLISSDLKNYVTDQSLMRKWNLNAGIETFISYKTKAGLIINAGPQFRYQLFSTYSKQYTYDEKLYNIGLKIGITTNF